MAGGSGFQPRFTRAIAVKNRSHNQKQQIQNYKVSFQIRLAVFLARGAAHMKLHNIRCHFQEISHSGERGDRRDYLKFSFSAFSAVNCYVSFSIKLAAFQASGGA